MFIFAKDSERFRVRITRAAPAGKNSGSKKMQRFTQRQLKNLVRTGAAVDVTNAHERRAIPEPYAQVGFSSGVYGCNGQLFKGLETGKLYAITARTTAIFIF